jgi:hypothetical protein
MYTNVHTITGYVTIDYLNCQWVKLYVNIPNISFMRLFTSINVTYPPNFGFNYRNERLRSNWTIIIRPNNQIVRYETFKE